MSESFIPVAAPALIGNEKEYVSDCLNSTWISSKGAYIDRFESMFADFVGVRHAITCSNGTVALHLALLARGVGAGDEILVPTFTYVATANAVTYCGAKPVFVDCDPSTWNLNPDAVRELITSATKGIIVVHLYGHPANMDPLLDIAREYGLFVLEDAAEAIGARYKGRPVGALGDIGTFSFFGNKIITTGEGGMLTTNDDEAAALIRRLKGQGVDPARSYWHDIVGYNYRMTNIAAAIGVAQMELIDTHIGRRREIARLYGLGLTGLSDLTMQQAAPYAEPVYWMNSVVLGPSWIVGRETVMDRLARKGIETRPFFYPMHKLPMYSSGADGRDFAIAERISSRGINLPSGAGLSESDVSFVCKELRGALLGEGPP